LVCPLAAFKGVLSDIILKNRREAEPE
jgi:hypothetical protein